MSGQKKIRLTTVLLIGAALSYVAPYLLLRSTSTIAPLHSSGFLTKNSLYVGSGRLRHTDPIARISNGTEIYDSRLRIWVHLYRPLLVLESKIFKPTDYHESGWLPPRLAAEILTSMFENTSGEHIPMAGYHGEFYFDSDDDRKLTLSGRLPYSRLPGLEQIVEAIKNKGRYDVILLSQSNYKPSIMSAWPHLYTHPESQDKVYFLRSINEDQERREEFLFNAANGRIYYQFRDMF